MASLLAVLGLLLNALVWGVSWWPFRQLQQLGVHPLWATTLIYIAASLALLVWRPSAVKYFARYPALWVLFLAAGLANVGFNWAVTVGDVVRAVLLFYLMPAWVVLLAWPILGERPSRASMLRLGLALCGVVVVLKEPDTPWPWPESLADYLALMGGFCFALTNVMLRKLGDAPPFACMLAMFLGGAVMAGATAVLGMQLDVVTALPAASGEWLAWVAGLSGVFLVANYGLQYGASRLSANAGSLVMLSEVVFASTSAVLLGAGTLTTRILLGGSLIMAAAMLSAWSFNQQTTHPATP